MGMAWREPARTSPCATAARLLSWCAPYMQRIFMCCALRYLWQLLGAMHRGTKITILSALCTNVSSTCMHQVHCSSAAATSSLGIMHFDESFNSQPVLRLCVAEQAKCVLDGETRMVPLMGQLTYAEVLDSVKDKFPGSPPFLLKYKDRQAHAGLLCNPSTYLCNESAAHADTDCSAGHA